MWLHTNDRHDKVVEVDMSEDPLTKICIKYRKHVSLKSDNITYVEMSNVLALFIRFPLLVTNITLVLDLQLYVVHYFSVFYALALEH